MSEAATRLRKAVVDRVLNGPGRTTAGARLSAFDNTGVDEPARALVDAVARHAWNVTDDDVTAAKKGRLTDDEIFELVVSAALGQSSRQLDSALAALDEATKPVAARASGSN